ncbi:MAG: hypothetical protein AAF224_14255 [Pseudomonadota bacterium]
MAEAALQPVGSPVSYRALTKLIGYALVEIRACDDLEKAQKIADVFHNTPAALAMGVKSADAIWADVEARAIRSGLEQFVRGLMQTAMAHA